MNTHTKPAVGALIRDWRQMRHLSQLDLALEAEISQKHLSFVESGRSQPSRDMVLRLAEHLAVPLRERNVLLLAAGFAPVYGETSLDAPALATARTAIETILTGHEPYPALAVNRHWQMLAANKAVAPLLGTVSEAALLKPPVNVLRLSLHPGGLAPSIDNLAEWRDHLLARLRHQARASADPILADLLAELSAYPTPRASPAQASDGQEPAIVVPLRLRTDHGLLSLISTTTVFGTPLDITLQELALETFFPADAQTAQRLRQIAAT